MALIRAEGCTLNRRKEVIQMEEEQLRHSMTFMDNDLFMCVQCGIYASLDDVLLRKPSPCKACPDCLSTHTGPCVDIE